MSNKVSYQTNFSGIKYNNNPLGVDIHSFSDANNVYLNKYNALISRPPIEGQTFPDDAYIGSSPVPSYLKIVGTYELSNGGVLYVVLNSATTPYYKLRYRKPNGITYEDVLNVGTITSYNDFALVQYKQYYILFNTAGAKALDTTLPANSWTALTSIVDVPVTSIQTGNEILELPANQLTTHYKQQFVIKPDSDDTIYVLPEDDTATVTFPSQTSVTYPLPKANEYTRDRLLRKLTIPAQNDPNALVSMVGEKIAIAHEDRFDLSLDYGETFQTIVYPTTSGSGYKNTASLSDAGDCFFYVHKDGVYRYTIGTEDWDPIEVTTAPSYRIAADPDYDQSSIESRVTGRYITNDMVGANYCHFINANKFAFMLAEPQEDEGGTYYRLAFYTLGTNITNLFNQDLESETNLLSSFVYTAAEDIMIFGAITTFSANPYLNKRLVKIIDNDTIVFYTKLTTTTFTNIVLKAAPTHLWRYVVELGSITETNATAIDYVTFETVTWSLPATELNQLEIVGIDSVKLLAKTSSSTYWKPIAYELSTVEDTSDPDGEYTYTHTLSITLNPEQSITGITGTSLFISALTSVKFLADTNLLIDDDSDDDIDETYELPLDLSVTSKVIIDGPNYLIYDATDSIWYTNIPILTTLTYTYTPTDEFKQVPTAVYADQNIWLGMTKTLLIGTLVDNKLSVPPINNNVFSKTITGIHPISAISKAIFFADSLTLCEEVSFNDNSTAWQYHPLKFSIGIRQNDSVITTNDGKLTIFPTKYGLAALTYQIDIAATEQAITYLTDDIKSVWAEFYTASTKIKIIHHNTQLILSNGTNILLIYDFRTNGWYPLTFPTGVKISEIHPTAANYEILELQPADTALTSLTGVYKFNKEHDELYTYATPYKDLSTKVIPWHLTSQLLLLDAPNNYKNISQLIIDQVDSHELQQSAYLTTQIFRQRGSTIKPAIELIYNIDTFAKIIKKVNWWKVLGFKWQLENDASSSYPTQLRLYNVSIQYAISYEVK